MGELRERNKEEKLRRIEEAGRVMFAERGFDETTTRALAARAGIGVGTLFVYFPQKRDLLVHLFVRDIGGVYRAAFGSVEAEASLVDALMHVFGALFDYYDRDVRLARVFVQELMFVDPRAPDPQLMEMTSAFTARLAELVTGAQERGELPAQVGAPEAAHHFFGAYAFNLIAWVNGMMRLDDVRWILRRALVHMVAGMIHPA